MSSDAAAAADAAAHRHRRGPARKRPLGVSSPGGDDNDNNEDQSDAISISSTAAVVAVAAASTGTTSSRLSSNDDGTRRNSYHRKNYNRSNTGRGGMSDSNSIYPFGDRRAAPLGARAAFHGRADRRGRNQIGVVSGTTATTIRGGGASGAGDRDSTGGRMMTSSRDSYDRGTGASTVVNVSTGGHSSTLSARSSNSASAAAAVSFSSGSSTGKRPKIHQQQQVDHAVSMAGVQHYVPPSDFTVATTAATEISDMTPASGGGLTGSFTTVAAGVVGVAQHSQPQQYANTVANVTAQQSGGAGPSPPTHSILHPPTEPQQQQTSHQFGSEDVFMEPVPLRPTTTPAVPAHYSQQQVPPRASDEPTVASLSISAPPNRQQPKAALHALYGQPPRRKVISNADYYTWCVFMCVGRIAVLFCNVVS